MLHLKRWMQNTLGFSRSQVNGFMILLPLMLIIVFSAPLYRYSLRNASPPPSGQQQKLDSLIVLWDVQEPVNHKGEPDTEIKGKPFRFDPNTASVEDLQKAGFSAKISRQIVHYRERGGKFRIKSDLLKIYSMDSALYQRLKAYILLPSVRKETKREKVFPRYEPREPRREMARFDLNLADTAQLKRIYGIGEKRSLRIVAYREKLGGYVSVSQLAEVYTLDSVLVGRMAVASFVEEGYRPRTIDINGAGEDLLAAHPYLSKSAAKAIVAYRFQHGEFAQIEDLAKIQTLNAETIQKIAPYLEFQLRRHKASEAER